MDMICSAGLREFFLANLFDFCACAVRACRVGIWAKCCRRRCLGYSHRCDLFSTCGQQVSRRRRWLIRKDGHTVFERGYGVRELRSLVQDR